MIKWFAILLVIVNIAVFIGRDKLPDSDKERTMGPPAIDLQHMMLSKEMQVPANAAEAIAIEEAEIRRANDGGSSVLSSNGDVSVSSAVDEATQNRKSAVSGIEPAGMVFKIDESLGDGLGLNAKAPSGSSGGGVVAKTEVAKKAPAVAVEATPAIENVTQLVAAVEDEVSTLIPAPVNPSQPSSQTPRVKRIPEPAKESKNTAPVQCYRVGPLSSAKNINKLLSLLEGDGIKYKKSDEQQASTLKAARVFVGPFANAAALKAQQAQLKAKKIDSFVLSRPDGRIIQLGYFSKLGEALQNAQSFQKSIEKKGVKVKISPEYEGGSTSTLVSFQSDEKVVTRLGLESAVRKGKFRLINCN